MHTEFNRSSKLQWDNYEIIIVSFSFLNQIVISQISLKQFILDKLLFDYKRSADDITKDEIVEEEEE
jgi:hypothetical protein